MRARMSKAERAQHDAAWGMEFGDPTDIRVVIEPKRTGLRKWFGTSKKSDPEDHPMNASMEPSLREAILNDRQLLEAADDLGVTLLHEMAMAGSANLVRLLLEAGANPSATTRSGKTPLDLATQLGWDKAAAVLGSSP